MNKLLSIWMEAVENIQNTDWDKFMAKKEFQKSPVHKVKVQTPNNPGSELGVAATQHSKDVKMRRFIQHRGARLREEMFRSHPEHKSKVVLPHAEKQTEHFKRKLTKPIKSGI